MKLNLLSSTSIDSLSEDSKNIDLLKNTSCKNNFSRRKLLKFLGIAGISASTLSLYDYLLPSKANGQCYTNYYGYTWCDPYPAWFYQYYQQQLQSQYGLLLLANLNNLILANRRLQIYEPSQGKISLVNDKYRDSYGSLSLTLVNSRSLDLEDIETTDYKLPGRSVNTFTFDNGPRGQSSGRKRITAWTARDNRSSDLTVFA